MDAFYASVEQRDNPDYRGKPLVVGHPGERGVVAAASYEARRYGIRSAMPSKTALRRCPGLIFVPGRFEVYKEVSRQIMDVFLEYTDLVEPLSLDEAFLDVTTNHKNMPSATIIARRIKEQIRERTELTASAGVSFNKFLAKIASDYNKPDGMFVITPEQAQEFIDALPVETFFGVGKVTAEKMHRYGIRTGADLRRCEESRLCSLFGKAGHSYYNYARGVDEREVTPDRIRKSVGAENTFSTDLSTPEELMPHLKEIADTVWQRTARRDFYGRTVTLKAKYADFEQITRSRTFPRVITDFEVFMRTATELLGQVDLSVGSLRLLGLSIGNTDVGVQPRYRQLELDFEEGR